MSRRDEILQEMATLKAEFETQSRTFWDNPQQPEESAKRLRKIIDRVAELQVELSSL